MLGGGLPKSQIARLLLAEHGALVAMGLVTGVAAAVLAVSGVVLTSHGQAPVGFLLGTLLVMAGNGVLWTWAATRDTPTAKAIINIALPSARFLVITTAASRAAIRV